MTTKSHDSPLTSISPNILTGSSTHASASPRASRRADVAAATSTAPSAFDPRPTSAANMADSWRALNVRGQPPHFQGSPLRRPLSPAYSNLSDIENETDDFGQRLIAHAKEQQWRHSPQNGSLGVQQQQQQAFKKARPFGLQSALESKQLQGAWKAMAGAGDRLALSAVDEEQSRELLYGDPRFDGPNSPASAVSDVSSEPSIQVPREWGRRGRQQPDWLRRINSSGSRDGKSVRTATAAGIGWAEDAADVALPSVEDSPSFSRQGTPVVVVDEEENDSLEQIRNLELSEDFTAGVLLTSTPAPVHRSHNRLASSRLRDGGSERPLSVGSKLREIRAQRLGLSGRVSASPSSGTRSHENVSTRATAGSTAGFMEGEKKTKTSPVRADSTHARLEAEDINHRKPQPVGHDSWDLLRTLSRVASKSPSPRNTPKAYSDTRVSPQKSIFRHTPESPQKFKSPSKSPQKKSLAHPASSTPQAKINVAAEVPANSSILRLKTPVVIGAWIDTPRPSTSEKAPSSPLPPEPAVSSDNVPTASTTPQTSPKVGAPLRLSPRKPKLPASALAAILNGRTNGCGKSESVDHDFGDSTVDSLASLITSPTLPSFNVDPLEAEAAATGECGQKEAQAGTTTSSSSAARRTGEVRQIQAMNARLRATRMGIRDARRGMRQIERRVGGMEDSAGRDESDSSDGLSVSSSEPEATAARQKENGRSGAPGARPHAALQRRQSRKRSHGTTATSSSTSTILPRPLHRRLVTLRRTLHTHNALTPLGRRLLFLTLSLLLFLALENLLSLYFTSPHHPYIAPWHPLPRLPHDPPLHLPLALRPRADPSPPFITTTLLYRFGVVPILAPLYGPPFELARDAVLSLFGPDDATQTHVPYALLTVRELAERWDAGWEEGLAWPLSPSPFSSASSSSSSSSSATPSPQRSRSWFSSLVGDSSAEDTDAMVEPETADEEAAREVREGRAAGDAIRARLVAAWGKTGSDKAEQPSDRDVNDGGRESESNYDHSDADSLRTSEPAPESAPYHHHHHYYETVQDDGSAHHDGSTGDDPADVDSNDGRGAGVLGALKARFGLGGGGEKRQQRHRSSGDAVWVEDVGDGDGDFGVIGGDEVL